MLIEATRPCRTRRTRAAIRLRAAHGLRPLVAALATAGACSAWAVDEPSPYYIGARQSLTYESNVYRIPGGSGDTHSSTALIGGLDQMIGRQRVYATGNVTYNKYFDADGLDNTSYGVNAGWDWATIEKLSGNVSVNANQNLASQYGNALVPSTNRNLVKSEQIATSVRWGGAGLISLEGTYAHSRVRYSAPESLSSRSDADTASLGAYFRLSPDLRLGGALRYTRTRSPYAIPLVPLVPGVPASANPDDYDSNTSNVRYVDFIVDWRSTAQTNLNARVSYTRQTNSFSGGDDFTGLTGSLNANYQPTAKTGFSASIGRDVGNNAQYFNYTRTSVATPTSGPITTTVSGLSENSQTTDYINLGASYAATAKIGAFAGLQWRRSKQLDTLGLTGTAIDDKRSDTYRTATLGATYDYSRSLQFACSLGRESRTSSGALSFSYANNSVSCSADFKLRL